jgi:hypothetical protein
MRRKAPKPYQPPFESCGQCVGGWVLNDRGEAFRCQCWLISQERASDAESR